MDLERTISRYQRKKIQKYSCRRVVGWPFMAIINYLDSNLFDVSKYSCSDFFRNNHHNEDISLWTAVLSLDTTFFLLFFPSYFHAKRESWQVLKKTIKWPSTKISLIKIRLIFRDKLKCFLVLWSFYKKKNQMDVWK